MHAPSSLLIFATIIVAGGLTTSGAQACDLDLTLTQTPATGNRGDQLSFTATADNPCPTDAGYDTATLTISGPASKSSVLFSGAERLIAPGRSSEASIVVPVPSDAPLGSYKVKLVLEWNGAIADQDSFNVDIQAPGAKLLVPSQYGSIGAALAAAVDGDTVEIASGTYSESALRLGGKAIVVRSSNPDDPAVVAATVVDGGNSGSVFIAADHEGAATRLEGLTIQGGLAASGGGIRCVGSSPTLYKCTFSSNRSTSAGAAGGGGLLGYDFAGQVDHCTFSGNTADYYGGGVDLRVSSSAGGAVFQSTTFSGNSAAFGGGLHLYGAQPTFTNCTFSSNSATYLAGGIYLAETSSATFDTCTVDGNSAPRGGGMETSNATAVFNDMNLTNNTASTGQGGGLFLNHSTATFNGGMIRSNSSGGDGAGIAADHATLSATNSVFEGNSATGGGGALHAVFSSATLMNATITNNTAGSQADGVAIAYESNLTAQNCILWGNGSTDLYIRPDYATGNVTYSDVGGGWSGAGNIDADPLLVNVAGGDFHLTDTSPCIDAGDNAGVAAIDFEGDGRISGAAVDMGADEYLTASNPINGDNWSQVTGSAAWRDRADFGHVVFNGKMWVFGGNIGLHAQVNDIWSSADGVNWVQETAGAEWSPRTGLQVVEFQGDLWLMGGIYASSVNDFKNDVWQSTDGITWTQVISNAPWSPRTVHDGVAYDGKLWVMGGYSHGVNLADVWSSPDGITWTQLTSNAPWGAGEVGRPVVHNGKLWMLGGSETTGAWSTTDGANWIRTGTISADPLFRAAAATDGVNMFLTAGSDLAGIRQNKTYRSADGVTWTLVSTGPWSPRAQPGLLHYNGLLWILGGNDQQSGNRNDVWYTD